LLKRVKGKGRNYEKIKGLGTVKNNRSSLANHDKSCYYLVMLVITGIFEDKRFIPDSPVSIPQKKKVIVTIEEAPDARTKYENKWREIGEAILNCEEELPGNPQPIQFRTVNEMDSL